MVDNILQREENADSRELSKFSELAPGWWDINGEMRLLHAINPYRLNWMMRYVTLCKQKILDVGCGGGILAESLAMAGATVKGIDLVESTLLVAKLHSLESGVVVNYEKRSVECLAEQEAGQYDIITCMEMLEHVPDPQSIIAACTKLLKTDGKIFFSTINRSLKAYLYAIIGAEYCLNWIARGTHDYKKFIRPAELGHYARTSGLVVEEVAGISYNPLTSKFQMGKDVSVNYFMMCRKSEV